MSFLSKVRLRTAAWAIVIAFAMTLNSPTFGQTPESDEKPESKQPAEKATNEKPTVSQPKDVVNPARLKAAQRAKLKGDHDGHSHQAGAKPGQDVPEPTVTLKPGEVPGIKFDMDTYDFGRIQAGGDVIHDFWFTNTGNGALEILRVKPG